MTKTTSAALTATIEQASNLGIVNGSRPVVGWFRFSPRRGAYGIRFFPLGIAAVAQDCGQGVTFTPAADVFT